jgi:hypothetical protein
MIIIIIIVIILVIITIVIIIIIIYIYVYIHTYIIGIHPYIRWNDVYVPYTAAQAPWLQSVAKSLLPGSDAYIPVKLGAKDAKDVVSGDPSTC